MNDQMTEQRIAQWQRMTSEDPENAMGWFSLGNACKQADRDTEAAQALRKAIELDPGLSRAYQLLGGLLVKADEDDRAAEVLTRGYEVAAERGDVMPMRAMGSLLEKIGKPLPQVQPTEPQPAAPASGDTIVDRRTGRQGTRMDEPPMRGPIGRFIQDHYSAETWREWIGMGTKVINELRLDFSDTQHQQLYDQHMMEWLGFTEEEARAYADHV
jgi:Fe-S cluster biosynthesis and repair protein YggX